MGVTSVTDTRQKRVCRHLTTLVMRLIEQGLGLKCAKPALARHDDLDALAGSRHAEDGTEFERNIAPFTKIDGALW